MSKTFLCKFMLCSEGIQFIFYSGVVYVRYHWGLVSSFVNKRASYRVNIYSKILILNMSSTFKKPIFFRVVQNVNCIYSRL